MLVIKKFWLILLPVLSVVIVGGCYFVFGEQITGPVPQYIMQVMTADAKTMRTVSWQTVPSEVRQQLVYRATNQEDDKIYTVEAQTSLLATSAEEMNVHTVTLTQLLPGTAYEYRVGSEKNWSDWYAFKTEASNASAFKAIVFGDSQSSDYGVWEKTAQAAWQTHEDARFFINMGDLVDIGSHYDQWKSWFNGGAGMLTAIPVAAISGNHENYLPGGTFSPASLYLALFPLPQNGPDGLEGQAYSFDYGDVHFVALDSQEQELESFEPQLIAKQQKWLEEDLKATQKPWKIVLVHRSLFKNSYSGAPNEIGERLLPIFDAYGVDLVFTAHIHTYGRTVALYEQKPVGKGKKGTVYLSTGRSGDKTWTGSVQKHFETKFDRALDQPNYLVLEAAHAQLKVTNFRQDGSIVDWVEISKEGN